MNIWKHGDIITAAKLNAMEAGIAENAENINTLAGEKQDVLTFDTAPTSGSTNPVTSNGVYNALLNKANNSTTLEGYGIIDAYTSDETDVAIAAAVSNLDSSDSEETGKYVTAVSETDGIITVSKEAGDTAPTSASNKMITSGAVFAALASKQDTLTFDTAPTSGSSNPVTSAGVYTALSTKVNASAIGSGGGIAELDSNGKVPASQLPSYVDDVVDGYYNTTDGKFYEESTHQTEIVGEADKIYISVDTNLTYRWTGSAFATIGNNGVTLGETSATAYRGDRGKIAYDHSQRVTGNPHNVTASDVGLGSVVNTGDSATPASGGTEKFTTGGAFTELAKKLDLNGGDSAACVTAFTSSDVADGSATSWTTVSTLGTGETHASIFSKVSQMFKNIRYLYKMLGTTDISAIGDGTVTGAISTQNDNFSTILKGHTESTATSANGYSDIQVTFGATYASTPIVVAGIRGSGVVSNFKDITVSCHSMNASGFKIRIYNGTSSDLNLSANWIAAL